MSKFIKEFKEFAIKGNVMDLAVGVIIGAAFGKIVTSLVNDIIMPPVGKLFGNVNFSDLFINLDPNATLDGSPIISLADANQAGIAVIAYGQFINVLLDFIIVAFCVFLLVRTINRVRRLQEKKEEAPAKPHSDKECPYCLSRIPVKATRCGHCTSQLPQVKVNL